MQTDINDILTLAGVALVTAGVGFIYFPAALILLGAWLIFAAAMDSEAK